MSDIKDKMDAGVQPSRAERMRIRAAGDVKPMKCVDSRTMAGNFRITFGSRASHVAVLPNLAAHVSTVSHAARSRVAAPCWRGGAASAAAAQPTAAAGDDDASSHASGASNDHASDMDDSASEDVEAAAGAGRGKLLPEDSDDDVAADAPHSMDPPSAPARHLIASANMRK